MLDRIRNHWFRLAGMLMGAALTLSTLVLPLQPAKAQCLGVDLGLVCAGLGVPSAFSHHPYYYDYPYPGYPPATAAPAPVPQYGSTAPAVEVPSNCRNDVCGSAIRTARTTNRDAAVGPLPADLAARALELDRDGIRLDAGSLRDGAVADRHPGAGLTGREVLRAGPGSTAIGADC